MVGPWSTGRCTERLRFANFSEAFGFMARVALLAEKADHHRTGRTSGTPWVIDLVSHDQGAITDRDVVAEAINGLL